MPICGICARLVPQRLRYRGSDPAGLTPSHSYPALARCSRYEICESCTPPEKRMGILLPIIPVYSVTHHPGLDLRAPPPEGGRTERHGLSSPIATVRQTPTGELSPMVFLVGVKLSRTRRAPPPDASSD